MRLIPVLDVMNGLVVRGIGGRRSEYKPLVSQLTSSTDPVEVARALIAACQPQELYLADLDALQGGLPASAMYRAILDLGVRLWVDAGISDAAGAKRLSDLGCDVVAGLETIPDPATLRDIVSHVEGVIFSLDLRGGVPLRGWPNLLETIVECGITRLIVLDLASVGMHAGTGTEAMCQHIASTYPTVEVIAGGGVRTWDDVHRLESLGVQGVLVASALHDGAIRNETSAS